MIKLLLSLFILFGCINSKSPRDVLGFASVQIPFSSDTLDYDYYTHHYAFCSVYGKLVSVEKAGEIVPQIAESWSNENEHKVWKFKLKKGLFFSNGDPINEKDVYNSFKRLVVKMNSNNSKSGLLEFLIGFDKTIDMNSSLEGLSLKEGSLIFKFQKSMPQMLDLVSFGMYGIVHSSMYNSTSGDWIDAKKVISSSAYEVDKWTDDSYQIKLRKEYQAVSGQINKINFKLLKNIKSSQDLNTVDMLVADKNSLIVDSRFKYIGSTVNLKIGYAQVHSWNKADSPLKRVEVRKWLRSIFLKELSRKGISITGNFIPHHLKNVRPILAETEVNKPEVRDFLITTHPITITGKILENNNKESMAEKFLSALKSLGENTGVKVDFKDFPKDSMYDISISGSGIESVDYIETLRFMFLSKEGINLPDLNGNIKKELSKENPDVNFINQEIWDQALIWPIRHYSSGYWFNEESRLIYDNINLDSASIDFQFLKWKD